MGKDDKNPYMMTVDLNVLNHLGINLYSNVPAVISEVVANSWDADASVVEIDVDTDGGKITVTDDGNGMTRKDANDKYLMVGYKRRDEPGGETTEKGRIPMGRKGIGKLSLFSVAKRIEVRTVKSSEKSGFVMVLSDIERAIEEQQKCRKKDHGPITLPEYYPTPLKESDIDIDKGTKIVISDFKQSISKTTKALKTRLARRFSVIGAKNGFSIKVNGESVSITDRAYFSKIKDLWWYGDEGEEVKNHCRNLENDEPRSPELPDKFKGIKHSQVTGWIGTVANSGDLEEDYENLNKIVVMVRGKLAQEDILEDINEGRLFSKYVFGELHADFLDVDEPRYEDSATTSRQEIKKDDPRYVALRKFVRTEITHIGNSWTELRNKEGTKKALEIPAIQEWFRSLTNPRHKRMANSLFGKINQIKTDDESEKRSLLKYGVLAFESLKYKDNLEALESITPNDVKAFTKAFMDQNDIEATLYHQIVKTRLDVIDALERNVRENVLEDVVKEIIYKNLWLLDTAWERATETPYMERTVKTEFDKIDAKLTPEEKAGRVDIKYKETSGKHIIIELKRAEKIVSSTLIIEQISKYRSALRKLLDAADKRHETIEVVCIVGKELSDWTGNKGREESEKMLAAKDTRVVMYQKLLETAHKSYRQYLDKREEAGRIIKLLDEIDTKGLATAK